MLPLEGIRVLEFCQFAAGPYSAMLLADMGAEVIKIESPDGGDPLRHWHPHEDGFSHNFASINRNKKSIALDLKNENDLEQVKSLVRSADVVIENFRPGVMSRLGLGYEPLKEIKPTLVYCSVSAYGQTGPRADEGGFDLTVQAMGGVMSVTGERGGEPVKCGVPIADFGTGLYAAFAISCALRHVELTGAGTHLDISMLGSLLGMAALQTSEYFGTLQDPQKLGSAHPRSAPYQAFRSKDGHIAVAVGNDRLWNKFCSTMKLEALLKRAEYATNADRASNQRELQNQIDACFANHTTLELCELLKKSGIPAAPINSYSQVINDEQVKHMGLIKNSKLPNGAVIKTIGSPIRMTGVDFEVRFSPPALGEHTGEFLVDMDKHDTEKMPAKQGQINV